MELVPFKYDERCKERTVSADSCNPSYDVLVPQLLHTLVVHSPMPDNLLNHATIYLEASFICTILTRVWDVFLLIDARDNLEILLEGRGIDTLRSLSVAR